MYISFLPPAAPPPHQALLPKHFSMSPHSLPITRKLERVNVCELMDGVSSMEVAAVE